MDKTDIILIQLLLQNSRRSYRELGEHLNLSANAIHKRIHELQEIGVIHTFTARISLSAFEHAVSVYVWGQSDSKSLGENIQILGKNNNIYWASIAGKNDVFIGAHLKNMADLEPFIAFIKQEGQMPNPTIGIEFQSGQSSQSINLSSLDIRIIDSLHKDSRKRISEVAEELGISAKTVKRRLTKMISEGSIEMSLEWYPDKSNDILTIFQMHLKPTFEKNDVLPNLQNNYSPSLLFSLSVSNLPNLLLCVVWTNSMKEIRDLRDSFENEDVFESIEPVILYDGYLFDTWRDEILKKKGT
jgi:DNA-binding Lrp family transcriptional regulator